MLVAYGPHLELQGLCLLCASAGTASLLPAFLLALGEQHPGFRWPKKEEIKNVSVKGARPPALEIVQHRLVQARSRSRSISVTKLGLRPLAKEKQKGKLEKIPRCSLCFLWVY